MGESRSDLIQWLNALLQLNITKIETLGSGAAYCQVIDSIYGDVPVSRVKFNAKQEYEYMTNFKVLQDSFKKHKIDKVIPVQGLMKCKMQDNLEFCQWLKKFWDANWGGEEYDAAGRRGGQAGDMRGATPSSQSSGPSRAPAAPARVPGGGVRRAPAAASASTSTARRPLANSGSSMGTGRARLPPAQQQKVPDAELQALTAQMGEMRVSVEALEKERDFYFGKLREIEIIVAARLEEQEEDVSEQDVLKRVQEILYQTEEGFEVPDEEEGLVDEEETF